jgi:pimeloyl-ACP methyl ester carboxylesterase
MSVAVGAEQFASVGEIELCYQTFGAEDDPPLLMVMGLGAQMVWWDDELCETLAARGRRVIRFDNRDIGRSTILRISACRPCARRSCVTAGGRAIR